MVVNKYVLCNNFQNVSLSLYKYNSKSSEVSLLSVFVSVVVSGMFTVLGLFADDGDDDEVCWLVEFFF